MIRADDSTTYHLQETYSEEASDQLIGLNLARSLQWNNGFDPTNPFGSSSDVKESKVCNADCLGTGGNYFCRDFFKYDRGLCCADSDPLCK